MVTNKMDLVFVDEYQDTNEIQHKLMTTSPESGPVTVVGDPDQTIYEVPRCSTGIYPAPVC